MSEPNEQVEPGEDGEPSEVPVSPETEIDKDEHDEEAENAETQPDEPIEAPEARSEKEIEKALKAVERAGTTYRNAIGRAMGEDAQALEPCPRCNAPVAGMIFPPEVAPVDDETKVRVLASVGEGPGSGPPLQDAKGVEECPTCLGHGQLKYPTRNPHVQTQMCPKCGGQGYVTKAEPQPETNVYTPPAWQPNAGSNNTSEYAPPDSWGRPPGHPHYGRDPVSVGV